MKLEKKKKNSARFKLAWIILFFDSLSRYTMNNSSINKTYKSRESGTLCRILVLNSAMSQKIWIICLDYSIKRFKDSIVIQPTPFLFLLQTYKSHAMHLIILPVSNQDFFSAYKKIWIKKKRGRE